MIATDLAAALDPVLFARRAGIEPDAWQADVLRSTASQLLLNCSRQVGKSTVTSLVALHTAQYQAGALVLLLSPSLRQSQELFRKVLDTLHALEGTVASPDAESALRLELPNGSRIIALPGKEGTIRGYSGVKLLVLDEASRVADDLYRAVRPMLAVSGGRLMGLSTPFGKRGWFHQEWTEGIGWERVQIQAEQCARIPRDFLASERTSMPAALYRQEYECSFEDLAAQMFGSELIASMFRADVAPLFAPLETAGLDDAVLPLFGEVSA